MHNNEQMIKPEQDSNVEKPHSLLPVLVLLSVVGIGMQQCMI